MRSPTGTTPVRYPTLICVVTGSIAGVLGGLALTMTTPIAGVVQTGEVVSVGIPLVRVLLDLAAATTVGLALLPVLIGADRRAIAEPVLAAARLGAVASALVWSVTALVSLVLQTAEFHPGTSGVNVHGITHYVATVGAGRALLVVAGLAFALAVLGVLAVRHGERVPAEARLGLGLLTLVPLPLTGHASSHALHEYAVLSIELHVLSVVLWTGGLGALAVLLPGRRALLGHALPRFSRLATVCLLVAAATGLFNGVTQLAFGPTEFWTALFGTPYGRLVLLKAACAAAIALLGAHVRFRLLPLVIRQRPTALATWATLELTVMGLAFGFAVVLSRAPAY